MIKLRARSMKAAAIVAISFLLAGVGATAATADAVGKVFVCKYVVTPGEGEVFQSGNNPISVSINTIDPYEGIGSYFADGQGRSYVLSEDNRQGGGQEGEPPLSDCPAPGGLDKVTPVALTPVDQCGIENDTVTGIPDGNGRYSSITVTGNTQTVTFTPGEGEELDVPNLPAGWTDNGDGTATYSHTFTDVACPVDDTPVLPVALTAVDQCEVENDTVTGIPDGNGRYSSITVTGNTQTVTFTPGVDEVLDSPLPSGWTANEDGTATYSHDFTNVECEVDLELVAPNFPEPIASQCDADGSLPALPDETASITYSWDGIDTNKMIATAKTGFVFAGSETVVSYTYDEPGSATGYQSDNPEGDCYTEQPEGFSGEVESATGQCTVPADGTFTTVTTKTPWTQEQKLNTETGVWTLGEKVYGDPVESSEVEADEACAVEVTDASVTPVPPTVVPMCGLNNDMVTAAVTEGVTYTVGTWVDGKLTVTATANEGFELVGDESWTLTDEATDCPAATEAPIVVPICGPNNDTVTLPTTEGVTYTPGAWVAGELTITATANEGYELVGEESWTFTDTPDAACPDEGPVFAFTPQEQLANTGISSDTGGFIGLALLLIASGSALVARKVRA